MTPSPRNREHGRFALTRLSARVSVDLPVAAVPAAVDPVTGEVLTLRATTEAELELAAAVENAHRLAGHEGIFFIRQPDFFMSRGPITSGPNLFKISGVVYTITGVGLSSSVPAGPSQRKIAKGDLVIVDIPTLVDGYHADQTRTYCLGPATEAARAMYGDLKAIADHLITQMRPGIKCSDIYRMAVEKAKTLGRKGQFQSFGRGKISRLIGHGIGLELNEPPIPSEYDHSPVDENYVIALDMHMMDSDVGVVKLEDMILIGKDGNLALNREETIYRSKAVGEPPFMKPPEKLESEEKPSCLCPVCFQSPSIPHELS